MKSEEILDWFPTSIREAVERKDITALKQVLKILSPIQRETVITAIRFLKARNMFDQDLVSPLVSAGTSTAVQNLEPLLHVIASAATEGTSQRGEVVASLENLQVKGLQLKKPVLQLWSGERNIATLTKGLDELHIALVWRILEIIADLHHPFD